MRRCPGWRSARRVVSPVSRRRGPGPRCAGSRPGIPRSFGRRSHDRPRDDWQGSSTRSTTPDATTTSKTPRRSPTRVRRLFRALLDLEADIPVGDGRFTDPIRRRGPLRHVRPSHPPAADVEPRQRLRDDEMRGLARRVTRDLGTQPAMVCELKVDGLAVDIVYRQVGWCRSRRAVMVVSARMSRRTSAGYPTFRCGCRRRRRVLLCQRVLEVRGEVYFSLADFADSMTRCSTWGAAHYANPQRRGGHLRQRIDRRRRNSPPLKQR